MSLPPVVVNFQIGGVADVKRAFGTIQDAMVRAERSGLSEASRATRERVRTAEQETKERIRLYKFADREVSRALREGVRDADRAEREKTRGAERWVRQRERAELDALKRTQRAREAFDRSIGSGMSHAFSTGVRGGARTAVNMAGSALSLGGGFGIVDSVHQRTRDLGQAADIANSGYMPTGDKTENKRRRSSNEILGASKGVGAEFGMDTSEVQGGLSKFVGKTGDLSMGLQTMRPLAELARATGSSFEDLASAAADVFSSDVTQSANDLMITLRAIAGQGKEGSIEIKDLAVQMAKVTASAGMFVGDKEANVITLSGVAQEARRAGGATSAAEATTSVARFASDVAKGEGKFAAAGIETKSGHLLRDPESIIKDSISKTKGDVSKLSGLFGERSVRGVLGYADTYRKAGGGSGDPKKEAEALKALDKAFESTRKAAISEAEQRESARLRMEEADVVWTKLVLQLRDVTANELLPAFIKLAPQLRDAIPEIGKVAKELGNLAAWMASNPFSGVGAILGAKMASEVASAGISELLKKAIGAIGASGNILIATATISAALASIAVANWAKEDTDTTNKGVGGAITEGNLQGRLTSPNARPQDVEEGEKLLKTMKDNFETTKKEGPNGGAFGDLLALMSDTFGKYHKDSEGNTVTPSDEKQAQWIKSLELQIKAMEDLRVTLDRVAKSDTPPNWVTMDHPKTWPHRRETMSHETRGGSP